jgi:hypothetical protein
MEFTPEFIQENGLTPEQITAINPLIDNNLSEEKKAWDGKANENAERILEGASNLAISKMGIQGIERNQGEKFGDFLSRTTPMFIDSALAKEKESLLKSQRELDVKIKSGGDESLKTELEETKGRLKLLQEKEATFSDWEENDYKGKWENSVKEMNTLNIDSAFNGIKPKFPDSLNEYETNYKWDQFKKGILEKNHIKIVDKEAILVDKENEYKTQKLKDALGKDENITALMKGENKGLGGKKSVTMKDIPFGLPENATSKDRAKAISGFLASQGKNVTDPGYAEEYAIWNSKIIAQKTA